MCPSLSECSMKWAALSVCTFTAAFLQFHTVFITNHASCLQRIIMWWWWFCNMNWSDKSKIYIVSEREFKESFAVGTASEFQIACYWTKHLEIWLHKCAKCVYHEKNAKLPCIIRVISQLLECGQGTVTTQRLWMLRTWVKQFFALSTTMFVGSVMLREHYRASGR